MAEMSASILTSPLHLILVDTANHCSACSQVIGEDSLLSMLHSDTRDPFRRWRCLGCRCSTLMRIPADFSGPDLAENCRMNARTYPSILRAYAIVPLMLLPVRGPYKAQSIVLPTGRISGGHRLHEAERPTETWR